jgi:hypothetical protein
VPTDHGLSEAVEQFVDQVSPALEAIADEVRTVDAGELHDDVLLEAFHLTAGFIDADELRTDDELRAFVDAFGPVYGGHLHRARPSDVRRTGTIRGRRAWLARPSGMFGILAATDARRGTRNTTTYYERALHIARVVASLDSQVSTTELHEIERFRTMLLDAIEEHGAPRPGRPEEPGPEPARSDDESPTPGSEPLGDEPLPPASRE